MSTLGNIVGGAALYEMTRLITGRKEKIPEVGEVLKADVPTQDKIMPMFYRAVGLSQMTGYMGIMSDVMKSTLDKAYGNNVPQEINNILYTFAADTFKTVTDFARTVEEDGISPELAVDFVNKFLADNIQGYRLVMNRVMEDKKLRIEKSNKLRDVQIFKMLEGLPQQRPTTDYNPFENKEIRKFREEQDPAKVQAMLPELLEEAVRKADGNMEVLQSELLKLKRHNYQTMPNPKTMPKSFLRYLDFLTKTQGPEAASARLEDYLKRNAFDRAKAQAVPSL